MKFWMNLGLPFFQLNPSIHFHTTLFRSIWAMTFLYLDHNLTCSCYWLLHSSVWHGRFHPWCLFLTISNISSYVNNSGPIPVHLKHASHISLGAERKCAVSVILVIIFRNFTMFQWRSGSPQVTQNLISSITNLVYQLSHELPNELRCRIFGN